jgi:hypothetical protein
LPTSTAQALSEARCRLQPFVCGAKQASVVEIESININVEYLDLLARLENIVEVVVPVFGDVCGFAVEPDGVVFDPADDLVAQAVRLFLRQQKAPQADAGLGCIGAMRDAADEPDEIVADAMKHRREEKWRDISVE